MALWPRRDIGESHVHQGLELAVDNLDRGKEGQGVFDGEVQDLVDGLSLVADLQRLPVIAAALAGVALDIDVRQEVHLHPDKPVALARLAAPALDVEAEAARSVAPGAGLGDRGEEVPHHAEEPGIGGRIGAGGAADGALVDVDDLVEVLQALDGPMGGRAETGAVQVAGDDREQGVVDECRFTGAGDAGDTAEAADGDSRVHGLQVVPHGTQDAQLALGVRSGARLGDLDAQIAGQVAAGERLGVGCDLRSGALGDHLPAMDPGTGTHVHHQVGGADRLLVVLDHDDGVADVAQVVEGAQQPLVVALVQADGRLVQDVHDADQTGTDLAREANALGLAAGEGVRATLQGQVVQSHVGEETQARRDLLDDLGPDLAPLAGQGQAREPGQALPHRQGRDRREVAVRDEDSCARPR